MRRRMAIAILGFVLGCGVKPDSHSGNDYTKSMAQPVQIGETVDDKVDADKGDNTDWKRFIVEDPGPLKVTVYWDSPKDIDATIGLYNGIGTKLTEVHHDPSHPSEQDTILLKMVQPDSYFVRIHANKGASVYTLEVLAGDIEGSSYGIPRPE